MSALRFICTTYSLSPTGTKVEMLRRLRMFASNQPKEDRCQQIGWRGRVESNIEQGKAWRAIGEGDAFNDNADDEIQGYFIMRRWERR
jgi:hypothetical protein